MYNPKPIEKNLPLYPGRYYEQILLNINNAIIRGDLKEGDLLPSEREMAEMYHISRVPIREAIKILSYSGVIEPAAGGGMVVKNTEAARLLERLQHAYHPLAETMRDLFDIRLLLESYAAGNAARNRTEEDLRDMQDALDKMEADIAADRSPNANSQRFHASIIAASGNTLLCDIFTFLNVYLDESREITLSEPGNAHVSVEAHREIMNYIKEQNEESARGDMQRHLLQERKKIDEMEE